MRNDPVTTSLRSETYLGFDFGVQKIGVAVGDIQIGIANPLKTIRSVGQKTNWRAISELVDQWRPHGMVVGISYQNDGAENLITRPMLRFCRQLEGRYGRPVHGMDETLTTAEAKRLLFDELGLRVAKMWQVQDQLAAQIILQSWFNDARTNDV